MTVVTEWFDIATVRPVNPGVYQVYKQGDQYEPDWARWDGEHWKIASSTFKAAEREQHRSVSCYNGDFTHWRGLAEKKQ